MCFLQAYNSNTDGREVTTFRQIVLMTNTCTGKWQLSIKSFIFCKISNIHIHLEVLYRKGGLDEGGLKCIIVLNW